MPGKGEEWKEGEPLENEECDDEEYEVEELLDHKEDQDGHDFYLVKWAGYGPEFNSWTAADEMSCVSKVTKFWRKKLSKKAEVFDKATETDSEVRNGVNASQDEEFLAMVLDAITPGPSGLQRSPRHPPAEEVEAKPIVVDYLNDPTVPRSPSETPPPLPSPEHSAGQDRRYFHPDRE